MKARLEIKTPDGFAHNFADRKRFFVLRLFLGIHKSDLNPNNVTTNAEDNIITWNVEGSPSKIYRITKALTLYDTAIHEVFKNNLINKLLKKRYSEEDRKEVEFMLTNMTSIKLVKEDG